MDGQNLLKELRQLLSEALTSVWPDLQLSYNYLYKAAVATVDRTNCITSSQTITTVYNQSAYTLDADFLKLYLMDDYNKYFIKYNDGNSDYFIFNDFSYDHLYLANMTARAVIPTTFVLRDATELTQLTGTATTTGSLSNSYSIFGATGGETTLTDVAADFSTVQVGDEVHNVTDGSHGYVVATSTSTAVICALFDGTNNFFTKDTDHYIINPQSRFQIVFDSPSSTAGHTITIPYIQKPPPVYSYYRRYKLPAGYEGALVHYAAWLYKYRDQSPNFGDALFKYWDMTVRQLGKLDRDRRGQKGFGVNFVKRSNRDRTFR